jgi:hypothetical protein
LPSPTCCSSYSSRYRVGWEGRLSPPLGKVRPETRSGLVFTLRGTPAQRAVDEAVKALERGGAKVEDVERLR